MPHAEKVGHVAKTCRYFGIGRARFYRWKSAYEREGEDGLVNTKTIPKNPSNQTPPKVAEKVLHLRRKHHLGPERIMWYLARYHGIKLFDATIYRILKRNGLNRLPRRTRLRKVHTKRYDKQDPGHPVANSPAPTLFRSIGRVRGKCSGSPEPSAQDLNVHLTATKWPAETMGHIGTVPPPTKGLRSQR